MAYSEGGASNPESKKKKPPPLPGDTGFAFRTFQKKAKKADAAPAGLPPGATATADAAEGLMEELGIVGEGGADVGGAAAGSVSAGEAASPEAGVIAAAVGIPLADAEKVWAAAQSRDDLRDLTPEALAEKLTVDFPLLTELMKGPQGMPQEMKPTKPAGDSAEGGGEIEPGAEKEKVT